MSVWTVKNAGETIAASHVNALQTEKLDRDGDIPMTGNLTMPDPAAGVNTGILFVDGTALIRAYYPAGGSGRNYWLFHAGNMTASPGGGPVTLASDNIGCGIYALHFLTTGYQNIAFGYQAAPFTSSGYTNIAFGYQCLFSNTTGWGNIAIGGPHTGGDSTLYANVGGHDNIAFGRRALCANVEGSGNIALGVGTMRSLGAAGLSQHNVGIGVGCLALGTENEACIAIGLNAGFNETGDYKFFVDSCTDGRNTEYQGRRVAFIYGEIAATAGASQDYEDTTDDHHLYLNSHIHVAEDVETIGPEKTVDGGLEVWASATDLTNWTESLTGTSTVNRDAAVTHGQVYSCRFDVDGSNSDVTIYQALTLEMSAKYRLRFWYKTAAGKEAWYQICNSAWANIDTAVLPAATSWTEVEVEFDSDPSNQTHYLLLGLGGAADATSSSIYIDDVSVVAVGLLSAESIELFGEQVVGKRVIDARIDDVPNSGDATTDGIIAALQAIVQTHGLGAAS